MINIHSDAGARPVAAWYGGSFDPPHRGHQQIVDRLVALPYLDRVIVTPAYLNPFKHDALASAEQRLVWCQTIFDEPKVVIDPGEVRAQRPVYSADTLARLNQKYDVRYIAIGSDNLEAIESWHNFDHINRAVVWLVFERKGYDSGYEKLRKFLRFPLKVPISSRIIRARKTTDDIDKKIAHSVHTTLTKGTP